MSMLLTFKEFQKITNGEWVTEPSDYNETLRGGAFDTRSVGDAQIFFAWLGENSDGHQFIQKLLDTSIRLIIVEQEVPRVGDIAILKVNNSLQALQEAAKWLANNFEGKIVSITGSCGKTTAKGWLQHLLSENFSVLSNIKSFNNHIGCPITVLNLDLDHEVIVLEMGTSGLGELELLSSIAPADVTVLLNVGHAHLGKLGSREAIYQAKAEIFTHHRKNAKLLIPFQDIKIREFMVGKEYDFFGDGAPMFSWELNQVDSLQMKQQLTFVTPEGRTSVWVNQLGEHVGETLSALLYICYHLGLRWDDLEPKLMKLPEDTGRSTMVEGENQVKILNDVYNANPESVVNMLKTLCSLQANRYVAVIGNLAEMDENLNQSAQVIVDQIPSNLTHLILTGETGVPLKKLLHQRWPLLQIQYFKSIGEVIQESKNYCDADTVIGVKGSRSSHMERVVYALSGANIKCDLSVCGLLKMCNQCDQL